MAKEGKDCMAYIAPFDVPLSGGDEPDERVLTVVQPDISVIGDKSKLDERGCRGAPDQYRLSPISPFICIAFFAANPLWQLLSITNTTFANVSDLCMAGMNSFNSS